MKKVLYTAVIGNYDNIQTPDVPEGWELKIFTKNEGEYDDRMQARRIKILPHKYFEYDECIWFDGNLSFKPTIYNQDSQFTLLEHPSRTCVYQEAEACRMRNKAPADKINAQIRYYMKQKYPENKGMVATGLIYRKNTDEVRRFCETWWHQLEIFTARDQLSFNYVAWMMKFQYKTLPFNTITIKPHNK